MSSDLSLKQMQKEWHGSLKSYAIGFVASLFLTSVSFLLATLRWPFGQNLVFTLVGLALAQAVCQMLFFLHLGQEAKPRWESVVFYFMLLILLIIAIGSLWIMDDLNDRVMSHMTTAGTHD